MYLGTSPAKLTLSIARNGSVSNTFEVRSMRGLIIAISPKGFRNVQNLVIHIDNIRLYNNPVNVEITCASRLVIPCLDTHNLYNTRDNPWEIFDAAVGTQVFLESYANLLGPIPFEHLQTLPELLKRLELKGFYGPS